MVTKKSRKGAKKSKGSKTSKGGAGQRVAKLAPTQDPIIITGGSVHLEFANGSTDGFNETASGARKRLAHKRNSSGKAELTKIEVFSPIPRSGSSPTPQFTIDLKALGIQRRCQIRVHYDVE